MAAFSLTGVELKSNLNTPLVKKAEEAIDAGEAVDSSGYIVDPTNDNRHNIEGVAISGAALNGSVVLARDGDKLTVTNTLTAHRTLVCKTSGQYDYEENLASGETHIIMGYTEDANTIVVKPTNSGKEKA